MSGRGRRGGGGGKKGAAEVQRPEPPALKTDDPAPPPPQAANEESEAHHDQDHCVICTETLDGDMHPPGVGACEHTGTCGLCFFRLRKIMGDRSCCICKVELENVYVFPNPAAARPYRTLNIWGDNAGPGMVFDDQTRMFVPKEFQRDVMQGLQAHICQAPDCRSKCKNMQSLKDHLRDRHDSFLCDICLENKKVFLGEQTLYSKEKLKKHVEKGEPELGFFGHPMCKFCVKRFYDTMHLYEHLTREHMECDLCAKEGIKHKYYRDYRDLEKHFRTGHFLCEHPTCLERKFIVFSSELEYQAHLVAEHPEQNPNRKVNVAFKVRGARRGGEEEEEEEAPPETFTAPPGGQVGGGGGEAEGMAGLGGGGGGGVASFQLTQDAFPDLSDDAARIFSRRFQPLQQAARAAVASSTSTSRSFTKEDFPALGGGSASSRGAAAPLPAFRHAVAPYQSRAALLHNDRDRWSYPEVPGGPTPNHQGGGRKPAGGSRGNGAVPPPPPPPPKPPTVTVPAGRPTAAPSSPHQPASPTANPTEGIVQMIGYESFDQLKAISQQLRAGELAVDDYYQQVMRLIPRREVRVAVMRDLLGLLPDDGLREDITAVMQANEVEDAPGLASDEAYPTLGAARAEEKAVPRQQGGGGGKAGGGGGGGGGGARKPAPAKASDWNKALSSVVGGSVVGAKKEQKGRITVLRYQKTGGGGARNGAAGGGGGPRPPEPPTPSDFPPAMRMADAVASARSPSPEVNARLAGWHVKAMAQGGGGGRGGGALTNDDFPALPPPPPGFAGGAGGGVTVVVKAGKRDDDEDDPPTAKGGGKKKGGAKKGWNDLQKAAFNLK